MHLPRRGVVLASAAAVLLLGNAGLALAMTQSDANVDPNKVTICHATDSDTNPYIVEEPAKDGDVSGHGGHVGPLWGPDLKDAHIVWGDIIPAFDYPDGNGGTAHYPGLNWPAGQATLAHGCAGFVVPALLLTVDKTNDADGNLTFTDSEVAATAGAGVPFQVTVANHGSAAVVIDSVVDKVGPTPIAFDCRDAANHSLVGQVLPVGASVTCTVTLAGAAPAAGGLTLDEVTVTGHQSGDCVLVHGEVLLRAASSQAAATCTLQTDPGNSVSATDGSSVSTPAGPISHVTPGVTVSPTPDATVSPTPEGTVEPTSATSPTASPVTNGGGTVDLPGASPSPDPFTGGGGTIVTLPHTGVPTDVLAGLAAGLMALGTWLTYAARRRSA
jgi:LPXTG-motif cell wall-anchored protein